MTTPVNIAVSLQQSAFSRSFSSMLLTRRVVVAPRYGT
jgi:hypothetical protein